MGLLELPDVTLGCSGEGAFLVAEELRLDQLGGNRGAIHCHERAGCARAFVMQGARHQLFARAGLAVDADARFAGGDAVDLSDHPPHGFAGPDHFMLADAAAEVAVFRLEALEFDGVLHGEQKLFGRERLLQKIESAEAGGLHRHLDVRLAGHHDYRGSDTVGLQIFEEGEAVAARHDDIGKNQVIGMGHGQLEAAGGVVADGGLVPGEAKGAGQRRERRGIVVHYKDFSANLCVGAHGSTSPAL